MKYSALLLLCLASQIQADDWPLDDITDTFTVRGTAKAASGVSGQSLVLDGASLIELKKSAQLTSDAFTVSLWFNPYDLAGGQQMLAGKNRYSRNERQWSLTIEPDGKLKAHLRQNGWSTISCDVSLVAGQWHLATLVVQPDQASLFLNGKPAGEVKLQTPIAATPAPITLGGIWDRETVRQPFHGALDEFSYQPRAWSAKEIAAAYRPVSAKHDVPKLTAGLPLWDDAQEIPKAAELPLVQGAEFHVLKQKRPDEDGCKWTLGVGLAWHKGKLYASYGFNKGSENTPTEEAHVRVSRDGGKTWDKPVVMDAGEGNLGVSHGVFLSHGGRLWAFMGAFYDNRQRTHTRAYRLNETSGQWEPHGVVIDRGFWPMQEPQRMADGNWIMAGFRVASGFGQAGNLPAVAISKGDDFTKWDLVVIPAAPNLGSNLWGESTVIVESKRILNIARYGKKAIALLSVSEDHGRSWTAAAPSNLPMATSKPYAGTLSSGQPYLVCTTTADTGGARSPLTIAVGKPGESVFSKVFLIRTSVFEGTPGVSDPKADFSYAYAVEHEGKLYIGYTHKSHAANELAVIPVDQLRVEHQSLSQAEPTNATEAAAMKAREEAELEQKYQSWVAELTPARQAWERTLQSQLGDFYLPIHKREMVAGQSNAWDFVDDDPTLPRLLLIGDSVSRGYTLAVRKALAGKANVHRAPANCGPTSSGLKNIDAWLGDGKWDLIHFNFGIHDRNTPIADYTQRLDQLIQRMQKTGATLVWASTTPIPDAPAKKQTAASIVERNKAAAELMRQRGIATNDLFNAVTPHLAEMQNPNDVHFNGKGYDFLGETVAKAIEAQLSK